MSNLTDALIAAKLVGGSGGSGGGSGLPEIGTVETDVIPTSTLSFSEMMGLYASQVNFTPVVGDTYKITWDGTDYTCVAGEFNSNPYIGNLGIVGSTDTGEPFVVLNNGGSYYFVTADTSATHTVSISGVSFNPPAGSTLIVKDGEWTPIIPSKHPVSEIEITITVIQSIPANSLIAINWTFNGHLPQGFSSGMLYGATFIKNGAIRPLLIIGEISASPKTLHGYAMNLSSSDIFDDLPTVKGLLYV